MGFIPIHDRKRHTDNWAALVFGAIDCADIPEEEPEERKPPCPTCDDSKSVRYWPDGVSQYQHPGYVSPCPECQ
jgi:hypothetical protein